VLTFDGERTPAFKLLLALAVAFVLTVPLVSVYLLAYDRQSQMREATTSITGGWGGAQAMNGPLLVIPYRATASETVDVTVICFSVADKLSTVQTRL